MKKIKTEQAVGHVLCHDITQIIPGVSKDAVFLKGHVVTEADIPVLLSCGKEYLYIWENDESKLHENEAAEMLCELCKNEHMERSGVKEGKIELTASADGLFTGEKELLYSLNSLGEISIASRHMDTPVRAGDKLCGMRVIPLTIEKEKLERAKELCAGRKVFCLHPYQKKRVGIVTTGNEVYSGRIADAFGPVLREKLSEFPVEVIGQTLCDDEAAHIEQAIMGYIHQGADMVLVSGGMSVDPDDRTPLAIRSTGAEIISYGAPVLPGAMFLLAYYDGHIPIMGLPGCVMYAKRTIFDLVLPRLMADVRVSAGELAALGNGGLCLNCEVCHFPNCGFGKG